MDPLELLARPDEWVLASGDGLRAGPRIPGWLDTPGFWDEVTIHGAALAPAFTVTVLDADGREQRLRATGRRWSPAELTVEYRGPAGLLASETRTVQPGGILVSEWRLTTHVARPMHLVAWTAQPADTLALERSGWNGGLAFVRTVPGREGNPVTVVAELACLTGATSHAAVLSDAVPLLPDWSLAPFGDRWRGDALAAEACIGGGHAEGAYFGAVHHAMPVGPSGATTAFAMRIAVERNGATREASLTRTGGTYGGASRRRWAERLRGVPEFRCSDPYLERYYWYRWAGLLLEGAPAADPASLPARVAELRWMAEPAAAVGAFATLVEEAREADAHGHGGPVIGDVGGALLALDAAWPDDGRLHDWYPALAGLARSLLRDGDPDESGLIALRCAARHADDAALRAPEGLDVAGTDATAWAWRLCDALAALCGRAGHGAERASWRAHADRLREAMRTRMWDAAAGMFSDIDRATGARTEVPAATAFLPYLTSAAGPEQAAALAGTLLDPSRFWTPYPVPSLAADDPRFSAVGAWAGRRHAAPPNGRVWPGQVTQAVAALAAASEHDAPQLRAAAGELLGRLVRMLFRDGDLERPGAAAHYDPLTGRPAAWRGATGPVEGTVLDAIFSYAAGIRAGRERILIDPFPMDVEWLEVSRLAIRGRPLRVRIQGEAVRVEYGAAVYDSVRGTPIDIPAGGE